MTKLPIERCIEVVLATFGALAGFALVRFITTAPPNVPNPLQSQPDQLNWLMFALAALLLRYMLGSTVHLYRTYVPLRDATPTTPVLPDWWTIIFFFKDLFFLVLFGLLAIKITQSVDVTEFINRSAIFILWGLIWGLIDFGVRSIQAAVTNIPMNLANYWLEINWIVMDAVQYILTLLILQTGNYKMLTIVFIIFLFLDVVVMMGHSLIPKDWRNKAEESWSKTFPGSKRSPGSGSES
jgi:hypothetical protein